MRRPHITALALLGAAALAACTSGSDDSTTPGGGPSIAPPDPNGVLLSGDPSDPALGALIDMRPSPVPPQDVLDGLLTTRLEGLLETGVTVEEVNDALAANSAAIVSMTAGFPAVTLVVPASADANAARARADALEATPAFADVTLSYTAVLPPIPAPLGGGGGGGGPVSTALDAARIPVAWNAADLLGVGGPRTSVVVADEFSELMPHPAITAQSFPYGDAGGPGAGFNGNQGFFAAGVIGGDEDPNLDLDIVHPRGGEKLDLRSLPMSGLGWMDRVRVTAWAFYETPAPAVLYTGATYEPTEDARTKGWRAIDALFWRSVMAGVDTRMVHVQPAGDHGLSTGELREARWCSPYALSESVIDLGTLLTGEDLENYERAELAIGAPPKVGRLRVVGSRQPDPSMGSSWDSPGADLEMVGEGVIGLCVVGECTEPSLPYFSTRTAAAQVAGIYSFLWGIKPTMSSTELLDIVDNAYFSGTTPNVVDAYQAVLSLDPSLGSAAVRRELLDVAAGTDVYSEIGDGVFDDHDIAVFVNAFDPVFALQGSSSDLVFDLNGDGEVGGMGTRPFDLDVNVPPVFSNVEGFYGTEPVPFDETAMTDMEILCYYSLTDLFTGDEERRDHLLEDCLPVGPGIPELDQFSLWGAVEAGLGTEQRIDNFNHVNQNTPDTVSETVTSQGTASALSTQSGFTIVVDSDGLERISCEGGIESRINANAPTNGTMFAESESEIRFRLEVPPEGAEAELHYSYTIDANLGDPDTYADGLIDIYVESDDDLYDLELSFDGSNVPPDDTQVIPLQLAEGSTYVDFVFRSQIGNNSASPGESVNIHLDIDWDFDFIVTSNP